jgi:hypothetical protein
MSFPSPVLRTGLFYSLLTLSFPLGSVIPAKAGIQYMYVYGQTVLFPKRDIFTVCFGLQLVCFIASPYLNSLAVIPRRHLVKNP